MSGLYCEACRSRGWVEDPRGLPHFPIVCGACLGHATISYAKIADAVGCDERTIARLDKTPGRVRSTTALRVLERLVALGWTG